MEEGEYPVKTEEDFNPVKLEEDFEAIKEEASVLEDAIKKELSVLPPTFGSALSRFAYDGADSRHSVAQSQVGSTAASSTRTTRKSASARNSPSKISAREKDIARMVEGIYVSPLLLPGLRCVFVGFNPGTESALKGHFYAHRTNLFWKLLYESGCVDEPVTFLDDQRMPKDYRIGFTDLVSRSTIGIKQLPGTEMLESVPILEARIAANQPRVVCLVGKGIWDAIIRFHTGKRLGRDFEWGVQDMKLGGSIAYVVPSTSGLAAGISRDTKLRLWKQLASLIKD